jgi:DNA invertase Pin-like site-specific DNA recombinase
VLVVTRLDRLTRSKRDFFNVLEALKQPGAGFRSLKDTWADTPKFDRMLIRACIPKIGRQ